MSQIHAGGCLCGEVRFTATGRPLQVMACHCSMCQKATGSAFSVEAVFRKDRVDVHGVSLATYSHRSTDHGRVLRFTFCRTCGTRVGLAPERFPDVQLLYAGAFDDPSWLVPASHIFTDNAVPWFHLPADAQCFRHHMYDAEGKPVPPVVRGS